jgi:hypothetical protein
MTVGTDIASIFEAFIEGSYGSSCTLTPVTRSNSNFGYAGESESDGTPRTVNCIPSQYLNNRWVTGQFGDLLEGEIALAIPGNETVDEDDKVVFESVTYRIRRIELIELNDRPIIKRLILRKKQ